MSAAPDGLLLVDKPSGPTSHDVVAGARRILGERRIGHTGTLDPLATGLLPLAIGRATRLIRYLPGQPKTYAGRLRLGVETDTDDVTGEPTTVHRGPLPGERDVVRAARALTGRRLQVPPAVSAKKIAGRRAYRLAREGRAATPAPVEVEILRFDVAPIAASTGTWEFVCEVSSGTYVRALARDLGASLGCGGALQALRRTRIGPFVVDDAIGWEPTWPPDRETLLAARLALDDLPLSPPEARVGRDDVGRFVSGLPVPARSPDPASPGGDSIDRVVRDPLGRLLGIGEWRDGRVHPRVVVAVR